jgi:heptosyltransferase-2
VTVKILIELPTWLGDCVMATPAIENIVNFHNNVQITFIGSFVSVEAMKYHPKVVKTVVLDKKYRTLYRTAKSLGGFDVLFSFRSSVRSKFLKFLISAKSKHQFDKNKYIDSHQVEKYNNFVSASLNIDTGPERLKLYKKNQSSNVTQKLILGINPGASYGSAKRWYPEEFARVASELSNDYDIVIFGGMSEKDIAKDIEKSLIKKGVKNFQNLAGNITIPGLINHISNLDLFITGDSGPMHVAAAFQIPTVAIFGPTKDNETSQWMNDKSIIVKKDLDCQPCMKRTCPLGHHDCMNLIKAVDVLNAVKSLQ